MSLRSRRGQIVIPALLIFPTLMLFVYLIYETSKLSGAKIKHQFAMDAAAFVEMTNYSDFLNRTAYVNGAFPMRIFEEGYWDFPAECEGKVPNCQKITYASLLFNNGAFPHEGAAYTDGHQPESSLPGGKWTIGYGGAYEDEKNANPPSLRPIPRSGDLATQYELFTLDNTTNFWHPWDLATEIYKLYVQIYSLLGSVEDAQHQVLDRLTTTGSVQHSFLQKSYWLNTGDPVGDAQALSNSFNNKLGNFDASIHAACLTKMDYWGNKHLSGGIQPYVPQVTTPDIDLTQVTAGSGCGTGGGLFQIEYLDNNMFKTLYNGLAITMPWSIPSQNFFNVPFATLMSAQYSANELHTTISVQGDPANTPNVWPNPTPKFQVRQFP